MQHTYYVLLNGPPQSGKTTIARELCSYLSKHGVPNISDDFAAPMRHFIATALGATYASMVKDAPRAELSGYSVREVMMDMSDYMREKYGSGIFGRWLYHRVGRVMYPLSFVICESSGVQDECNALGHRTIVVHVKRPNKEMTDYRQYLEKPRYTIDNDGDIASLWIKTHELGHLLIAGRIAA